MAKETDRAGRRISIRVSAELYALIEAAAEEREWSLAHWVERAIEERLGTVAKAIPRKIRRAPPKRR